MIRQSIAKDCPHTRKANGVILLSPDIVAGLAGAVSDPDEWAIVLQGIRSEDAYEITVTGWRLPEQERNGGHVDLSKDVLQTPFSNPTGNDVCVVHLHPGYGGAHFSGLDKDKLNTRYPASIVLCQSKTALLGFEYSAVGKVQLPCGGKGEIEFKIQPMTGPALAKVSRVTHKETDLGDCIRAHNVAEDPWKVQWKAECGLMEKTVSTKPAAFGISNDILDVVAKLPRERQFQGMQQWQQKNGFIKNTRKLAVGWVCPKDQNQLYWSIAEPGKMHCDKCNGYFTEPKEEKPTTTEVKANDDDMTFCEACGAYVADGTSGFQCSECEASYCIPCDTYHDGKCLGHVLEMEKELGRIA